MRDGAGMSVTHVRARGEHLGEHAHSQSSLVIVAASVKHSGAYACKTVNSAADTVTLHVIQSELSELFIIQQVSY